MNTLTATLHLHENEFDKITIAVDSLVNHHKKIKYLWPKRKVLRNQVKQQNHAAQQGWAAASAAARLCAEQGLAPTK